MTLTFRSLPFAPVTPRPSRQPSHVPPWLVAEARLVRALPAPRTGMIRQLLAWSLATSCALLAVSFCICVMMAL
ncbi:MAG: hypothetical protein RIT24_1238 [Planctomycetota bacterium]